MTMDEYMNAQRKLQFISEYLYERLATLERELVRREQGDLAYSIEALNTDTRAYFTEIFTLLECHQCRNHYTQASK
jgi:hypothetical protein